MTDFDALRAAVAAGEGLVMRFPGLVCLAAAGPDDAGTLVRLHGVCRDTAGSMPGRTLARRLATWLGALDEPPAMLRFVTVAAADDDRLAVFCLGAVSVDVGGQTLRGADSAVWVDRLLARPAAPVLLMLDGASAPEPSPLHDLRQGIVPGSAIALTPAAGSPAPARRPAPTAAAPTAAPPPDAVPTEPAPTEPAPAPPPGATPGAGPRPATPRAGQETVITRIPPAGQGPPPAQQPAGQGPPPAQQPAGQGPPPAQQPAGQGPPPAQQPADPAQAPPEEERTTFLGRAPYPPVVADGSGEEDPTVLTSRPGPDDPTTLTPPPLGHAPYGHPDRAGGDAGPVYPGGPGGAPPYGSPWSAAPPGERSGHPPATAYGPPALPQTTHAARSRKALLLWAAIVLVLLVAGVVVGVLLIR